MSLDRRALLRSLATVLLVPDRARAATVTDSAGRSVPVPTRVERVFPAGPPRRDHALYACTRSAARLAAGQPSARVCLYATGHLHPAGSWAHHRARQYG